MERFKQSKIANGIEKEIDEYSQKYINDKYKGTKIIRNGLEYVLFNVNCNCGSDEYEFKPNDIRAILTYTIISDLEKEESKELIKAKKRYEENDRYMGYFDSDKFKRQLWINEQYDVPIERIIEENINLEIKEII